MVFFEKIKYTWCKFEQIAANMLTKLPTHAVCSAMYFQDFAPDPVAHDKPTVWSFTQKDFVKEDEDWVLL